MNDFIERFKSYSTHELLKIVLNRVDYHQDAVDAAQGELDSRNLSQEELKSIENDLKQVAIKKKKQQGQLKEAHSKTKDIGHLLFHTFTPLQKTAPTTERLIRAITIVFGLLSIYRIYQHIGLVLFMIREGSADLYSIIYMMPALVLALAMVPFWKRKRLGWVLLCAFLAHSTINGFGLLWHAINYEPSFPALQQLFPPPSLASVLFIILFYGGSLFTLTRPSLREDFNINNRQMWMTIVVAACISLFVLMPYL